MSRHLVSRGVGVWLAIVVIGVAQHVEAYGELRKFLFVSSSDTHQVAYAPLALDKVGAEVKLRTLIDSGLTYPQGLAVDPWRRYLYVADPTLKMLVYYELTPRGEDRVYVGDQMVAAKGVEVRWVSVDSLGNVYFTEESTQRIMRVTAANLDAGKTAPELVFEGSSSSMVSAPGGIAIDNYFAFWTNKLNPAQAGTVARSLHAPKSETKGLANINAKCYGVCMAVNNVFFTEETKNVYGLHRNGGKAPVKVSSSFQEPRGCAFDGQNTIYVADKKKNAVYTIPGNMPTLRENLTETLVANMQGAYGVAVFTVSDYSTEDRVQVKAAAGRPVVSLLLFAVAGMHTILAACR
jgi:DNA-binding beta-propeller fold protein YncE